MVSTSEDFCEHTASRIDDLYESYDDIIQQNPRVELYGKTYSFRHVQKAMTKQTFITTRKISNRVNVDSITVADKTAVKRGFENIPRAPETCVIQWVCVEHMRNVIFSDAEMKHGKLFPPRFSINVGHVAPNSSVRINTGFVFKIPSTVETRQFKDGKIVRGPMRKQTRFVIVPHITCTADDFVPCLYVRDSEDTGLFTVNFTTISGRVGVIQVVLKAYRVKISVNNVSEIGSERPAKIFKPKDTKLNRNVKNLKVKIYFDSIPMLAGYARFKTLHSNQMPEAPFEHQQLCITKLTTLITSRKCEWNDPNLVTLSGLYSTQYSVPPKILCGSKIIGNTHCLTLVDSRLNLFSEIGHLTADIKIINEAFSDQRHYSQISKNMRQCIVSIQSLSAGARTCKMIIENNSTISNLKNLLRLFDYHRNLRDEIDDESVVVFKCRPTCANAYSAVLYEAMKYLISIYFQTDFTSSQLEELKMSIAPSENANDLKIPCNLTAQTCAESISQPINETVVTTLTADVTENKNASDSPKECSQQESPYFEKLQRFTVQKSQIQPVIDVKTDAECVTTSDHTTEQPNPTPTKRQYATREAKCKLRKLR